MLACDTPKLIAARRPTTTERPRHRLIERAWMFIDLVDSTTWYVSLGDAFAFTPLRACLAGMGRTVAGHRGEVVKLTGDGLHAGFDRPADALACAVAYQREHRGAVESRHRIPKARIGLSLGTCVRYSVCDHVDYSGPSVILAARLAGLGEGGGVVMSEEFVCDREVAGVLSSVPRRSGLRRVRGFPRPLRIFRLDPAAVGARAVDPGGARGPSAAA